MDSQPNRGLRRIALRRIISPGMLGAQRTALEWAMANGIAHCGYVPSSSSFARASLGGRFRVVKTGLVERVCLFETCNRADGVVIFSATQNHERPPRSLHPVHFRTQWVRPPILHLAMSTPFFTSVWAFRDFLITHHVVTLCVMGSASYEEDGVDDFVRCVLDAAELVPAEPVEPMTPEVDIGGITIAPGVLAAFLEELRRVGWTGNYLKVRKNKSVPPRAYIALDHGNYGTKCAMRIDPGLFDSVGAAVAGVESIIEEWNRERVYEEQRIEARIARLREIHQKARIG